MSGVGRRRLLIAVACYGAVQVAALGIIVWALPSLARFLPHAPGEFWIVAALAVLVDAPLRRVGPPTVIRVRSTLSTCVAVAIFVHWGGAPAIIVMAVAASASAAWQGFDRLTGPMFVARHVCALAVAGSVTLLVFPRDRLVHPIAPAHVIGRDLLPSTLIAVLWAATSFGVLLLASAPITGYAPRRYLAAVEDMLVVAASIVLVEPLLLTVSGGWNVLVTLPLFAWTVLARSRLRYERRLNREPVSGVLNRSGLVARVDELMLYDHVKGTNPSEFGIVFVSVESMLNINRDLGREAYEGAIRELARRLVTAFGDRNVARLTGEGGVIVVPGLTRESALAAGEKAARLLVPAVEVRGIPFDPEPAAGVALSPADGRDLGALLGRAESAMREARRLGVPATVLKGPQTDQANRRFEILAELRRVLLDADRDDEIGLHFQPQVELGSGRLHGVEALVRWHHPQWGPVPPDVLIDAIERSVLMHQLTLHVLEKALRQVAAWNARDSPIRVAVNASVRDLLAPAFADEIEAMLLTHGVAPPQLTIEVTESMLVGGDPRVARTASRITELGVGLAIDDFGTGYASIDQLRTWPLTEVKIDKSYVENVVTHPAEWALVESVHSLARALGLRMVAEGVEDEQTAAALARLPGTIGQGWHFGRPMTAAALEDWLVSAGGPRAR